MQMAPPGSGRSALVMGQWDAGFGNNAPMVAVQAIGVGSQQRTLLWQVGQAILGGRRLPHLERHPVLLDTRGSRPRSPPRC